MTTPLTTIDSTQLADVSGANSLRSSLVRKAIQGAEGAVSMIGRTHFTAPPFNEGLYTATGEFTHKGTGIPLVKSFTATVDSVRRKVLGLTTKIVAE